MCDIEFDAFILKFQCVNLRLFPGPIGEYSKNVDCNSQIQRCTRRAKKSKIVKI